MSLFETINLIFRGYDNYPFLHPGSWSKFFLFIVLSAPALWILTAEKSWDFILGAGRSTLFALLAAYSAYSMAFHWIGPKKMADVVDHPSANSFYTVTQLVPIQQYLGNFSSIRKDLPLHATSNMPGKVLLFYFLTSLVGNDLEFAAFLLVLLSSLGAIPIFKITERITENKSIALFAAFLYLVQPGRLIFLPILNAVTPTIVLCNFWLFFVVMDKPNIKNLLFFGLSLFTLFLFEPLPLCMGLLYLTFLAYETVCKRVDSIQLTQLVLGTVVTFLLGHILFLLSTGFNSIESFFDLLATNTEYYAARPTQSWFWTNTISFLVSLGHFTLIALGIQLWRVIKNNRMHAYRPQSIVFWIGAIATFLMLNISGVIREEIARLWIFLGSFAMIGVAITFAATPIRYSTFRAVILANLFMTAIANRIIGFLTW